jgi:hypothetical protein
MSGWLLRVVNGFSDAVVFLAAGDGSPQFYWFMTMTIRNRALLLSMRW